MLRSGVSAKLIRIVVRLNQTDEARGSIRQTYVVGLVVVLMIVREAEVDLLEENKA